MKKLCLIFSILFLTQIAFAGPDTHISGIVADPASAPVEGVTVILNKSDDTQKPKAYKTRTDSKGNFHFDNVDSGTYDITCQKKELECPDQTIQIDQKESRTVFLVLGGQQGKWSGKLFHFKDINPKTARVFVAYSTVPMKAPKTQETPAAGTDIEKMANELPYSTMPEMGAIMYGGKPTESLPNAFSSPGSSIISLNHDSISLLDTKSKEVVGAIPTPGSPVWLVFAPDGTRFWAIDSLHNLTMYGATGDQLANVNVGDNLVTDLGVTEHGDRLYMAVRTWPVPEVMAADGANALIGTIDLPKDHGQPGGIAVAEDGRIILVTMGDIARGWLAAVDPAAEKVIEMIPVGKEPLGVAITPDNRTAVVADYGGASVSIVDLQSGAVKSTVLTGLEPARVVIGKDGKTAYVTNRGDDSVSAIDIGSGSQIGKAKVGNGPMALALTSDGKTLYVVNHDSANVSILDARSLDVIGSTSPIKGVQAFGIAIKPGTETEFEDTPKKK